MTRAGARARRAPRPGRAVRYAGAGLAAFLLVCIAIAIASGPRARIEPYRGSGPAPGAITAFDPPRAEGAPESGAGAPAFLVPGSTDRAHHRLGTIARSSAGDTLVALVYGDNRPGLRLMTTPWGLPVILEASGSSPASWLWAALNVPVLLVQCFVPRLDLAHDLVSAIWSEHWSGGGEARVRRAIERERGIDLIVHTGDVVEDGRRGRQWDIFERGVRALRTRVPLVAAPGNHERLWSPEARASWDAVMGPPAQPRRYWFAIDLPDTLARFVFLDSEVLADPSDHYDDAWQAERSAEQLAWADSALAAPARWRFLVLHHPLVTSGHHFSDWKYDDSGPAELRRRARLIEMCRRRRVTAVFAGHEHLYQRTYIHGPEGGGFWHVTTGGGGSPLYRIGEKKRLQALAMTLPDGSKVGWNDARSVYHYCRLVLPRTGSHGAARLEVREVLRDGKVRPIDAVNLDLPPSRPEIGAPDRD